MNRWLVEMSQVRRALTGFLAEHEGLWINESERVNDNLPLDRLDWVDNNSDSSWGKLFERLLGVDIDGRKPASKTRM